MVKKHGDILMKDVVDCEKCGFRHVVPLPDRQSIIDLYQKRFYEEDKVNYFDHYKQDEDWWRVVYRARYTYAEKHLESTRKSVLDIGTGPGLFLDVGRNLSWDATGIEPSTKAVEYATQQGLDVIEGFFDEEMVDKLGGKGFNFVHMSQVLEHVLDPGEVLSLSRQILASDGLLCVVVPNDFNQLQNVLHTYDNYEPWWIVPEHHINYFSFASLRQLMEKQGFEVVYETATFPMELFLLMGDNYIGSDKLGRECHTKRMRMEMLLDKAGEGQLKEDIYSALAKLNIGREIVMYARKTQE